MSFSPLHPSLVPGGTTRTTPQRGRVIDSEGNDIVRPQVDVELDLNQGPDLVVTSGRIIACDPMLIDNDFELPFKVAAGRYRTEAWIAKWPSGEMRVAMLAVRFADKTPRKWKDRDWAFGVDSGTACVADASVLELLDLENGFLYPGTKDLDEKGIDEVCTAGADRPNVVRCCSGFGDGWYHVFWSYEGLMSPPSALVIDCGVIETAFA